MKAISLHDNTNTNSNPWAMLIEAGLKTIETRRWPFPKTLELPMDILICATADSKTENSGKAVCVVMVTGSHPMQPGHEEGAMLHRQSNLWAWQLTNLRWLSEKFVVAGHQRVFNVDLPEGVTLRTPTTGELSVLRKELFDEGWIMESQM